MHILCLQEQTLISRLFLQPSNSGGEILSQVLVNKYPDVSKIYLSSLIEWNHWPSYLKDCK